VNIAGVCNQCARWARLAIGRCPVRCSAVVLLSSALLWAQAPRPSESQVKAAYLYNFGKFVTWPSDRAATSEVFYICVLGKDPFGSVLDETVNGERIDGKKIGVLRISRVQEAGSCNILFVSSSEEKRLPTIILEAQRVHVLTVSDIPHFAERGGTIGLVNHEDRIRFEVNRTRAEECHLGLSSELLKVAVKVIGGKPAGS
jgi:YfiR/HmsC-like